MRIIAPALRDRATHDLYVGAWGERHTVLIARSITDRPGSRFFSPGEAEQGFVDESGTFLNRHEATKVALAAGQATEPLDSPGLGLQTHDLY